MRGFKFGFICSALALSGAVAACGSDDDGGSTSGSGGTAGSGGSGQTSTGGSGGSAPATTAASGGSEAGGSGGSAGADTTTGGTGGTDGTQTTAGSGGTAGDGGAPPEELAPITKVTNVLIPEANEIFGLSFGADGKLWASGATNADPDNQKLVIARFNPDGTPDTDFADEGFLVHDVVPGGAEMSRGIVELANGDIIVQANIDDGKGGELITDAGGGEDMARLDGRNVVLLRFDSEGALVDSFGDAGVAHLDFGWTSDDDADWPVPTYDSSILEDGDDPEDGFSGDGFPHDDSWGIALDATGDDEKIVVFGYGPPAPGATDEDGAQRFDNDRYVLRVLASDGSLDPDFNDGAPFTFGSPGVLSDGGRRGSVEPDGSILSAGYTNWGEGLGNHVMVLHLLEDGTPDPDFGFGLSIPGVTWFNPFREDGGVAECYAVGRQSTGRLVTTGYGRATGENMLSSYGYATTLEVDMVAFGFNPGSVDLDWGNAGTLAIQSEEAGLVDTQDRGRDLVVLPDDRTIHAGRFGGHPALFVVTPDGHLDTSVGEDGKFLYEPFAEASSHFYTIASNQNLADRDELLVAAATNTHPEGVILAILKVEEE